MGETRALLSMFEDILKTGFLSHGSVTRSPSSASTKFATKIAIQVAIKIFIKITPKITTRIKRPKLEWLARVEERAEKAD
ncbi:hypothetical protein Neosp_007783 [[Neocosmospora] mangrovei]